MLRLPPRADQMPALLSAVRFAASRGGSVLAIAPSQSQVAFLATRLSRAGVTVAVDAARLGARQGGRRRGDRVALGGVGAVCRAGGGGRPRRARRGPAGGTRADLARPRRGARTLSASRCPGRARVAGPDPDRGGRRGGGAGRRPPRGAARTCRLAPRHRGRPHRRGPMEALARHLGADRPLA